MSSPIEILGNPADRQNLHVWEWLKQSKIMALGWTAMRVWLGIMWIQAGAAKLWGAENAGFLHNKRRRGGWVRRSRRPRVYLVGKLLA